MAKRIGGITLEQLEKNLVGDIPVKTQTEKRKYTAVMLPEGLYEVQSSSGGRLPDCLVGKYTSIAKLNALIEPYNSK